MLPNAIRIFCMASLNSSNDKGHVFIDSLILSLKSFQNLKKIVNAGTMSNTY